MEGIEPDGTGRQARGSTACGAVKTPCWPAPNEVVAIPIVVDGMIAAVFYGDNVPGGEPIGSIRGIELLMIEAGLAMERRFLQAKLQQVEGRLQSLDRAADREVVE